MCSQYSDELSLHRCRRRLLCVLCNILARGGVTSLHRGSTFSVRHATPLYRLITASHRVAEVLTALAQGLDVAAAVLVFGHRQATISTWLTRATQHSATLHDHFSRELQLPHIQLDEIRTRLRSRAESLWLWLALDPITKLIPVLNLG